MSTVKYTKEHEWVRVEDDVATIGITNYAQEQLGDVVFVELPEVDSEVEPGNEFAVVESVKAASEVYSPVGGTVVEVNEDLAAKPGLVNEDAEGEGWFVKVKLSDPDEVDELMDARAYKAYVDTLS
jgi:glycine cleavage system H protein